jgi:hypothetical protein
MLRKEGVRSEAKSKLEKINNRRKNTPMTANDRQ